MKQNLQEFEKLLISILIPIFLGFTTSLLTKNSTTIYSTLIKPNLSPPPIVFPIVWTVLYILMGISAFIVYSSDSENKKKALSLYIAQLFFNITWTFIFFNLQNYLLAVIWTGILIVLVVKMIVEFYKISPLSAYLQIPYFLWCVFAMYLTLGVYMLNP
ncbi:MAG: TspO/MBR family protein [Anaerotignaceae bacterium]